MSPLHVINANDLNFEYEVIAYSQNVPVVVDFWAEWCNPCKYMSPILERLAEEAGGAFRLARVDVDSSPNLAMLYNVRTLPTIKAFSGREPVAFLAGAQPEARLREFIASLTPPAPMNLVIEKGANLIGSHQWAKAEELFRKVLENNSDQPASLLGLAMALLGSGKSYEASEILERFPASREYRDAELLMPLAKAMEDFRTNTLPSDTDLDAAFMGSIRLSTRGNIPAALDGLLDILREEKHYRNDLAKQVVLGLLELLGEEDPQTREYRSELGRILY